jgi:hypothetical protein
MNSTSQQKIKVSGQNHTVAALLTVNKPRVYIEWASG